MRQDNDETIRSLGVRVRGQAVVCEYQIKCQNCNTEVSYTEQIIRDVIIRDLTDSEIQLDLLGDKNQDMLLEDVLKFVEAKESGKRSAGRLFETQTHHAASTTDRNKRKATMNHPERKATMNPAIIVANVVMAEMPHRKSEKPNVQLTVKKLTIVIVQTTLQPYVAARQSHPNSTTTPRTKEPYSTPSVPQQALLTRQLAEALLLWIIIYTIIFETSGGANHPSRKPFSR